MDSIVKSNKSNVNKMTKQPSQSLEAVLSSKHKKANEFIKRVKLSFWYLNTRFPFKSKNKNISLVVEAIAGKSVIL